MPNETRMRRRMPDENAVTARDGWVLGIDEAGRGAAIGPLVVAAVALDERAAEELRALGVRDSKDLERPRLDRLAEEIRRLTDPHVCVRSAREVDIAGNLDCLERCTVDEMLTTMDWKGPVVADGLLFEPLEDHYPNFKAVARADEHCLAVAAASVIAKACREELFDRIKHRYESEYGEIKGGGYDEPGAKRFLRAYHARTGKLPPETRLRWRWKVIAELRGGSGRAP